MYGERIRQLRLEKGMKIKDLASELGIPLTTLGNYEREAREPNSDIFIALANYFEVSTDYLLGRTDIRTVDEYFFALDTNSLKKLLRDTPTEVRQLAAGCYEEMYFIMESAIHKKDVRELHLFKQILVFFNRMKQGFIRSKFAKNRFAPTDSLETFSVYIKEKNELDNIINELFTYLEDDKQYRSKKEKEKFEAMLNNAKKNNLKGGDIEDK